MCVACSARRSFADTIIMFLRIVSFEFVSLLTGVNGMAQLAGVPPCPPPGPEGERGRKGTWTSPLGQPLSKAPGCLAYPHPRDAFEGKGPQRRPLRRLDRRLEEVAKAVGGGYCRLQLPLKLAIAVRGTVAGRWLGALEAEGGGGVPAPPCNASLPHLPTPPSFPFGFLLGGVWHSPTPSGYTERCAISLGDIRKCANSVGFWGLVPLFPHFCPLSVPEVGVCGVYSESP